MMQKTIDWIGNLFNPPSETWVDCDHQFEIKKQIAAMPRIGNEAGLQRLVLDFLCAGEYNELSRLHSNTYRGKGYTAEVHVQKHHMEVFLRRNGQAEDQITSTLTLSKHSKNYWFGELITENPDVPARVIVIAQHGKEVQICRRDMENPPHPFENLLLQNEAVPEPQRLINDHT